MKQSFVITLAISLALLGLPVIAQSQKLHKGSDDQAAIPKGSTHIVLKSENELKQVFVYSSILAIPEVPEPHDGLYRIELNEKGKVAAVTILRGISPSADTGLMKQFVSWYAKPGPVRIVDLPVPYSTTHKFIDPFTSMRTGLPPGHRENPKP